MKRYVGIAVICALLLLTGCWDQRQFKNIKLGMAGGFDTAENNQIKATVVIPTVEQGTAGLGDEFVQVISAVADTPREARAKVDNKISKIFDGAKVRAILIGEELAKKDLLSLLDVFYRNPKTNLNARLALVRGEASEVLELKVEHEPRISGYLYGLLHGQVMTTQAPNANIQLVMAEMMDPSEDFALPMIEIDKEENLLDYVGLALFKERTFSGVTLTQEQSKILLILDDNKGQITRITKRISNKSEENIDNFVTIDIGNVKRKIKITADSTIEAKIELKLNSFIVEYPKKNLNPKEIKKIEQKLSKILTEEAVGIVSKLQEANSDVLGIGTRVKAYHNKKWKQMNWREEYPDIKITPEIKVTIQGNGIIN